LIYVNYDVVNSDPDENWKKLKNFTTSTDDVNEDVGRTLRECVADVIYGG